MRKCFEKLISHIFPIYEISQSNRKVDMDIKDIYDEKFDFQYAQGYKTISSEKLKEFLKETQEIKKTLEEKAKSSLIAITLSISLVLTLSKTLVDIKSNLPIFLYSITFLVGVIGIGYLVLAGILSLYALSEINQVATIYPGDINSINKDFKNTIASSIELNSKYNTKRNNLMNGSYKCIMNALICFFFLFISLSIFPKSNEGQGKITVIEKEQKQLIDKINKLEDQRKQDLTQIDYLNRRVQELNNKINQLEKLIINIQTLEGITKEIDEIKKQQVDIKLRIDKSGK